MQVSFDPANCGTLTVQAVVQIIRLFHPGEIEKMVVTSSPVLLHADGAPGALAAAGLGTDADRPDQRDPAAVFGQSATPLPLPALSTAGAGLSQTAPAALPGSLPAVLPGTPLPAAGVLPLGNALTASAAQTSPAVAVDVDVHGLPWDARIHAGTKRKNADGSWTAKKGINDPALVARVQAELRGVMALPAGAAPLPAAGAVSSTPAVQNVAQVAALPLPLPLPVAAGVPANFDEMMPRITAAVTAGTLPQDALLTACQAHGLPSLVSLTARADYVATIWAYLKGQYPALV